MPAKIKISNQWKDISKIFIKVAGQWKTVQQGFIKILGQWKQIFVFATNPNQTSSPSAPIGNGAAGTSLLVGGSGSYTNYISISKSLIYVVQGTSLTDGLTTPSGTVVNSSHTVTQLNATTPPVVFYTRDAVLSLDGITQYYYYSQTGVTAFIDTFTDTFDFGNIDQINSTLNYLSYKNPNPDSANSWSQIQVPGSNPPLYEASNTYTPAIGDSPTTYPMKTIEVGKSSVNLQASLPFAFSGPGLAFWVTARGSWWAVGTYYNTETTSSYNCSEAGSGSSCPSEYVTVYNSANVGKRCTDPCTSSTTYSCGGGGTYSTCGAKVSAPYSSSDVGRRCSCNLDCSDCSSSTTVYGCSGSVTNATSCPSTYTSTYNSSTVGQRCSNPCGQSIAYPACAGGDSIALTLAQFNAIPSIGCTGDYTATCSGVYEAGSTTISKNTYSVVECVGNDCLCASGYESSACPSVGTSNGCTEAAGCPATTVNNGKRCSPCTFLSSTTYYKKDCTAGTGSLRYSYSTVAGTAVTTYTYSTVQANTTYSWTKVKEVTSTSFISKLKIYSASNNSVVSMVDHIVGSSNSQYKYIYGIKANVAGDTIEASAYSNESLTTQLGLTVSYTAQSPVKALANGESSVGIIKLPADQEGGSRLDNFKYTRV